MKNLSYFILLFSFVFFFISCEKDNELIHFSDKEQLKEAIDLPDKSILDIVDFIETALIAGQSIDAGTVRVSLQGEDLLVTYSTTDGFELEELHLWIGTDLSDMPQTGTGNPKLGHFPYKEDGLSGTFYQFVIPVSELGDENEICDQKFIVVAHADLVKFDGNGNVIQREGAWGEGEQINEGGNKAMSFGFTFECKIEPPCEGGTAFSHGDISFIDAGLTDTQWGWIIVIEEEGTHSVQLYSCADGNDTELATVIGNFTYSLYSGIVTVEYKLANDYYFGETNVYVSNNFPGTIIPEEFGYHHVFDRLQNDYYQTHVDHGTVYIIGHANVFYYPDM